MKAIHFIITVVLVSSILACDTNSEKTKNKSNVIIYGRSTCGYTTSLKDSLDIENISYIYKDINVEANKTEMWEKVQSTDWFSGGSVGLPIVDVNGNICERPKVAEIQSHL